MTRYDALSLPPVTAADLLGYARGMRRTIILYALALYVIISVLCGAWGLLRLFSAILSR